MPVRRSWMRALAVLAFLTAGSPAIAQSGVSGAAEATPPPEASRPTVSPAALSLDQRFMTDLLNGRYLQAMELIEQADPSELNEAMRSSYRQFRPMLDGFVVDTAPADPLAAAKPSDLAEYEGAVAEDAIAEIVGRARRTRVVIINETHDNPRDRAFILRVAEALRPLGFNVYAAETFANFPPPVSAAEMEWLVTEGYPRFGTGTFTADPMFGFLVRRAMELGYRPIAYEIAPTPELFEVSVEERIVLREQTQAENLARAIAAAEPDAKFLIHVGYGHAAERPIGRGERAQEWMAARLARLTGIDPLTIDQTYVSEFSERPQIRALHAALAERIGSASGIFVRDREPVRIGQLGEATDLQVVHPLVRTVSGRPDWLEWTGRKAVAIPADLLPAKERRLVQAFVAGEADRAVPVDQALVVAGEDPPVLYVPDGVEIRWAVQD